MIPIRTCSKNPIFLIGTSNRVCGAFSQSSSGSRGFTSSCKQLNLCYPFLNSSKEVCSDQNEFKRNCLTTVTAKHNHTCILTTLKGVTHARCYRTTCHNESTGVHSTNLRLLGPKEMRFCNTTLSLSAGLFLGLICYSTSEPSYSEAPEGNCDGSSAQYSHGKKVLTDYSVIGIPGDGRCMFRSVAHGACVRSGKLPPDEKNQRDLADELRARVADEFIKRREETEWFIEGDFDTYVSQMRKPHVWGGEPEMFMASHVLRMPITVYMRDKDSNGLISIAEYGQEYGKDNPVKVLYHGFGHYDALHIPGDRGARSRL